MSKQAAKSRPGCRLRRRRQRHRCPKRPRSPLAICFHSRRINIEGSRVGSTMLLLSWERRGEVGCKLRRGLGGARGGHVGCGGSNTTISPQPVPLPDGEVERRGRLCPLGSSCRRRLRLGCGSLDERLLLWEKVASNASVRHSFP